MRTKDLSSIIAAADDVVKPSRHLDHGFLAIAARAYELTSSKMSTNSGLTPLETPSVKVSERGDFIHPAPRTNLSPTPPIQAIDTRARNKEN